MASDDRGPLVPAVCYPLVSIAFVAFLLRCYARLRIVKKFGGDDWCMVVAMTSFALFVASSLTGVHHGAGRHLTEISTSDRTVAMKAWWFCYLWYTVTMVSSKVSISWFLLRIVIQRSHVWIIYVTMAITVVSGIVFFCITLLQCKPISYFWERNKGSCMEMEVVITITYVYTALSILCDLICTILPMFIVLGLNMDRRSKMALIPIMALACVASAAIIVRIAYIKDSKDADFLYATINIVIWSAAEQGLAVTAGCLATLRPLLRAMCQNLGASKSHSGSLSQQRSDHPLRVISKVESSRRGGCESEEELTHSVRDRTCV